jgi:hypothetical protein
VNRLWNIFVSCSPIRVFMTNPNDRHRVYMSFIDRQGWQCQFLEAYLQTPLPKRLSAALAASERSGEAHRRGRPSAWLPATGARFRSHRPPSPAELHRRV